MNRFGVDSYALKPSPLNHLIINPKSKEIEMACKKFSLGIFYIFLLFSLFEATKITLKVAENLFPYPSSLLSSHPKLLLSHISGDKVNTTILNFRISHYGGPCARNFDCAINYGLACVNSTCLCPSPKYIARFGPDKTPEGGKVTECVLKADSECVSNTVRFAERKSFQKRTFPTYLITKIVKSLPFLSDEDPRVRGGGENKCVDNAQCVGGKCQCSPDHFKDDRGLCLRKRTVFHQCENSDHCRSIEGLECIEGQCQCKMSMVYDDQRRKCLVPEGSPCDAYSTSKELECVNNAECSNDHCTCLQGFIRSSDGSCGVSHGKSCSTEKKCSDIQLTCRSGTCQCRYPVHQKYNETSGLCVSKPDGPCNPDEFNKTLASTCIPFAECVKTNPQEDPMFEYACKCVEGYEEDQVGDCVPSYSSDCTEDDDCDQVGQLSCVNGKCTCPDEMLVWDRTRRKCVGVVGARCKYIQLERILSWRMDVPTECVENAVCVEHVTILDGRCQCKEGSYFYKDQMKCVANV